MYSNTNIFEAFLIQDYSTVHRMLEENIREESAKKSGSTDKLKIVKSILKIADKHKPILQKAQPFSFRAEKWYAFVNGYIMVASPMNFGYEVSDEESKFKPEPFFDKWQYNTHGGKAEIQMADVKVAISEDKAFQKCNKIGKVLPFEFEIDGMPTGVNPNYLKMAMDFTGSNVVYGEAKAGRDHNCNLNPLYLVGEQSIALVMPIILL